MVESKNAHCGASVEIVQQLLTMGAWRTLKNADGDRPVDIARIKGHHHLLTLLEPVYKRQVSPEILQSIQENFHSVICGRAEKLVQEHSLRLPELEPLLEMEEPQMWFPLPGMYGGFKYYLQGSGDDIKLISESWCRVIEGSGQQHEITSEGSKLVAQGFV